MKQFQSSSHLLSWSCPVVTSSSCRRWVNWSSSSTRSRSEMMEGCALKPSFLMANMTSTIYCTRLSSCPSCRMLRRRSKMAAHQTKKGFHENSLIVLHFNLFNLPQDTCNLKWEAKNNNKKSVSLLLLPWKSIKCHQNDYAFFVRSSCLRKQKHEEFHLRQRKLINWNSTPQVSHSTDKKWYDIVKSEYLPDITLKTCPLHSYLKSKK